MAKPWNTIFLRIVLIIENTQVKSKLFSNEKNLKPKYNDLHILTYIPYNGKVRGGLQNFPKTAGVGRGGGEFVQFFHLNQ